MGQTIDPVMSNLETGAESGHDPDGAPLEYRQPGAATGKVQAPALARPDLAHSQPLVWRVALWAALSAAFTLLVLQYSFSHDRLLLPPRYDDNAYMADGLERLEQFYRGGMRSVVKGYAAEPPHAPLSTALAFGSFALLGVHDWAPYAANGLCVFMLLGFVDWLMKGAATWQKLLAFLFVLSFPISARLVTEFRPDVPCGLALCIGLCVLLRTPLRGSSLWHKLAAGAWAGLAMWMKPAFFPATIGLFGLALLLRTACDIWAAWAPREGRPLELGARIGDWFICALPLVLIPGPHFLFGWRHIIDYITVNTLGETNYLWADSGGFLWTVRYFLDGAKEIMFGKHLYVCAVAIAVGAVLLIRRKWAGKLTAALAFAVITFVAYLLPTINPLRSPYFATTFNFLVIALTVLAFGLMLRETALLKKQESAGAAAPGWLTPAAWPAGLFVLLVAAGLVLDTWPRKRLGDRGGWAIRAQQKLHDDVFKTLRDGSLLGGSRTFVTARAWSINQTTLRYRAVKESADMEFADQHRSDDVALYQKEFGQADFVLAGEVANSENWTERPDGSKFPSDKKQDEWLTMLRGRPDFIEIATFPTLTGKSYHIFERRDRPFGGWKGAEGGIGPITGALLQLGIPKEGGTLEGGPLRDKGDGPPLVGLRASGTLVPRQEGGGAMTLAMSAVPAVDGVEMVISVDGKEARRHRFSGKADPEGKGTFEEITVPLDLRPGLHRVEFMTRTDGPYNPFATSAVIFRKLQLAPKQAPTTAPTR